MEEKFLYAYISVEQFIKVKNIEETIIDDEPRSIMTTLNGKKEMSLKWFAYTDTSQKKKRSITSPPFAKPVLAPRTTR